MHVLAGGHPPGFAGGRCCRPHQGVAPDITHQGLLGVGVWVAVFGTQAMQAPYSIYCHIRRLFVGMPRAFVCPALGRVSKTGCRPLEEGNPWLRYRHACDR